MNKITNDEESSDRVLNVAVFVFAVILNLTLLVVFTKKIYLKKISFVQAQIWNVFDKKVYAFNSSF